MNVVSQFWCWVLVTRFSHTQPPSKKTHFLRDIGTAVSKQMSRLLLYPLDTTASREIHAPTKGALGDDDESDTTSPLLSNVLARPTGILVSMPTTLRDLAQTARESFDWTDNETQPTFLRFFLQPFAVTSDCQVPLDVRSWGCEIRSSSFQLLRDGDGLQVMRLSGLCNDDELSIQQIDMQQDCDSSTDIEDPFATPALPRSRHVTHQTSIDNVHTNLHGQQDEQQQQYWLKAAAMSHVIKTHCPRQVELLRIVERNMVAGRFAWLCSSIFPRLPPVLQQAVSEKEQEMRSTDINVTDAETAACFRPVSLMSVPSSSNVRRDSKRLATVVPDDEASTNKRRCIDTQTQASVGVLGTSPTDTQNETASVIISADAVLQLRFLPSGELRMQVLRPCTATAI